MKAAIYEEYGPPEVLQIRDLARPEPNDNQALIRVRAAALNPLDAYFMSGRPYVMRLAFGLRKPANTRPGVDLCGQVEAVGRSVKRFRPGDHVFGVGRGAFAEYVCAVEDKLAHKPARLSFEQAAALPVAGLTALQGLRDKGRIQPGHDVLIHAAAGGVGTFAVQMAKSFGARVTAVCSAANVELVRSIGADQVIDSAREDFTRTERRYDLLFDCAANRDLGARRRLLKPKGVYVAVGFGRPGGGWIDPLGSVLKVVAASLVARNLVMFVASVTQGDLEVVKELVEAGKVTPVIDRTYPLTEVAEAVRYLQQGHARGKVVISVAGAEPD